MTSVGFEPTLFRTGTLIPRLRPLGHDVFLVGTTSVPWLSWTLTVMHTSVRVFRRTKLDNSILFAYRFIRLYYSKARQGCEQPALDGVGEKIETRGPDIIIVVVITIHQRDSV